MFLRVTLKKWSAYIVLILKPWKISSTFYKLENVQVTPFLYSITENSFLCFCVLQFHCSFTTQVAVVVFLSHIENTWNENGKWPSQLKYKIISLVTGNKQTNKSKKNWTWYRKLSRFLRAKICDVLRVPLSVFIV